MDINKVYMDKYLSYNSERYKQIIKEYADYKPKSPMDDARNSAKCRARLSSLECEALSKEILSH